MLISEMTDKELKKQIKVQRKSFPAGDPCLEPYEKELHRRQLEKQLLTVKQTAAFLSKPEDWVLAMCKQGRLPYNWSPEKGYRFDVRHIAGLIPPESVSEALRRARRVRG
jgi:hypothetical protein